MKFPIMLLMQYLEQLCVPKIVYLQPYECADLCTMIFIDSQIFKFDQVQWKCSTLS